MSASLVGSEMCIRDRTVVPRGLVRCIWRVFREEFESGHGSGLVRGRRAVSYTHLTLPTICSV
eukprot:13165215-Alexandrium_andersonii.AAC.1